jgi:hypothetical protein
MLLLPFLLIALVATALTFLIPRWRRAELWPYTVLVPIVAGVTWQLVFQLLGNLMVRIFGLVPVFNFVFPSGLIVILVCSLPGAILAIFFVRWLRRHRRSESA